MAKDALETLAARLKEARYRSGFKYLLEAKRLHVSNGHMWTAQLDQCLTECKRGLERGTGAAKKAGELRLHEAAHVLGTTGWIQGTWQSQEELICRVLLGHARNRSSGANTSIMPNKKRIPQKMLTQLLACLHACKNSSHDSRKTRADTKAYNTLTGGTTSLTRPSTWQQLANRCPRGAHAEGAESALPLG